MGYVKRSQGRIEAKKSYQEITRKVLRPLLVLLIEGPSEGPNANTILQCHILRDLTVVMSQIISLFNSI
jgi:hypothetical protein